MQRNIKCPKCGALYLLPSLKSKLKVSCRKCNNEWILDPPSNLGKKIAWLMLSSFLIFLSFEFYNQKSKVKYISYNYESLIERYTLTHNGETIEEVLKLLNNNYLVHGLLQPYLEPFSYLLNDALSTINEDKADFKNIVSHFPEGSAQPAWVALFREGHYQIFYNNSVIRVFLKNEKNIKSNKLSDNHKTVIRHPLLDLTTKYKDIKNIEIYGFTNNYKNQTIRLNVIPAIFPIENIKLNSNKSIPDIRGIEKLFSSGVDLRAIEVDANKELFFYGLNKENSTLDKSPMSISDLAVIYRSIFHFYKNDPYISLDLNEDNRYAKVNFGGHLQNTRVGQVVLDADKMFKTLGTGLYNEKLILEKFRQNIPNFLTEGERTFLEPNSSGTTQIRYWFYPDSIGTVTDGSIGALTSHYFSAAVERMDKKIEASNAVKNTIEHLNKNYSQYEKAHYTFTELSTVGKLMGLVNWLYGMDIKNKIDLDEFLSVMLPPHQTPKLTKKLLAAQTIAYVGENITYNDLMNNTKVFNFSDQIDKYSSTTTDDYFLELASTRLTAFDWLPKNLRHAMDEVDALEYQIEYYSKGNESLKEILDYEERYLNRNDSFSVDRFNDKVNDYNQNNSFSNLLNEKRNRILSDSGLDKIKQRSLSSVGGGINLRPKSFKKIKQSQNSKIIDNIKIKKNSLLINKISKKNNGFIANIIGEKRSNINEIPSYVDMQMFNYKVKKTISKDKTYIKYIK